VLAYFFSYLDRVNLGFAALTMNADLKFTPLIFAWGAGIFFISYFIFEVPSNLAGFGGPYLIGWVKDTTGSTSNGLLVLSLLPLLAGLLVFLGGHETKTEFAGAKK
jgi:hypothetical protein